MPLARIITRLPQETASLAEYLRTQGYTVEAVSSRDDDNSTPADLEISAEQYPFADAMARAREIAARGWEIMVAPGVIDAALQMEPPAELTSELGPSAELRPEPILESTREPAPMEAARLEPLVAVPMPVVPSSVAPLEVAPIETSPIETARTTPLPRRKMTRNRNRTWNSAWSHAGRAAWFPAVRAAGSKSAQRTSLALGKITAAAGYLWQTGQREAARFATRWREFAAAQRAQSALRAANMAAKMKQIRRLREERETLENAARLRRMESERETRIRQAQEREQRARLLQLEAERESQRRAEHAAQLEAQAEQARIRELQRQMQLEAERESQAESIHRKPVSLHLDSVPSSGNFAHQTGDASVEGNRSADIRRRNPRQRDWEMAFAGAAAVTVVLILAFGVLGARRPAEKFAPTHAVEQQLPFGAATIHPAAGPSTIPSQPAVAAKPPAPQSVSAGGGTAPKLLATSATPTRKRRSTLPNNDSNNDSDAEVVVRHFAPLRAPAKPAAKKSAGGVKHYSDID